MGIGPEEKRWGRRHAELTHRHVGACSNKGIGHGVYELATHTKVTQFNLPTRVDQYVGGLDIYIERQQTHVTFSETFLQGYNIYTIKEDYYSLSS